MTYGLPHRHALFRAARARTAMGGDEPAGDPVVLLIGQVNRFTGVDAPATYRMSDKPYTVATGNLALVAPIAAVLYQRAATDSYNQYGDRGSAQQIERANQGLADPVGFVSKNMVEVTSSISSLADSLGLAASHASGGSVTRTILIVGAVAFAVWMISR